MRFVETLNDEEVLQLQSILHDSDSYRKRMRAHAILLSNKDYKIKQIADICEVDRDTVSSWFTGWEKEKLASLSDAPRSGRPSSLNEQEKKDYCSM